MSKLKLPGERLDLVERRVKRIAIVCAIIAALCGIARCGRAGEAALLWCAYDQSMLAPALELGRTRAVVEVLNPADGPGAQRDIAYGAHVTKARALRNLRLVGYIDLVTWRGDNWTVKNVAQINRERELWHTLYGIVDYWLDDCFSDQPCIRALVGGVSWGTKGRSFANAGDTVPSGHWLRTSGFAVCDYEDDPPRNGWTKCKGPCVILFATAQTWRQRAREAQQRGATIIGFEDVSRHHNGDFQRPFSWWTQLK